MYTYLYQCRCAMHLYIVIIYIHVFVQLHTCAYTYLYEFIYINIVVPWIYMSIRMYIHMSKYVCAFTHTNVCAANNGAKGYVYSCVICLHICMRLHVYTLSHILTYT